MAIYIGSKKVNKIYLGGVEVKKVYLGNTLKYTSGWEWLNNYSGYSSRVYYDWKATLTNGKLVCYIQNGLQTVWWTPGFNMSDYKTVEIVVSAWDASDKSPYFGFSTNGISYTDPPSSFKGITLTGVGTYTIDVSSLTGTQYLKYRPTKNNSTTNKSFTISSVRFIQ